jgi:5-formyltetrahydrofolate cyclo-ligase
VSDPKKPKPAEVETYALAADPGATKIAPALAPDEGITQRTDPATMKQFIRELARKNRVAQKNKEHLSTNICGKFMALPSYSSAKTVMWYVDTGSEVRTRYELPAALDDGKRVVVPWCVTESNTLELFLLEDMSELVEGAYKILEPREELRRLPSKIVKPHELDLVMVPGTAFDKRGARMGQGKGYYDRLLAGARADAPLVALAFDCQMFDEIPVDAHDVFMDLVLTETRAIPGKGRKK